MVISKVCGDLLSCGHDVPCVTGEHVTEAICPECGYYGELFYLVPKVLRAFKNGCTPELHQALLELRAFEDIS